MWRCFGRERSMGTRISFRCARQSSAVRMIWKTRSMVVRLLHAGERCAQESRESASARSGNRRIAAEWMRAFRRWAARFCRHVRKNAAARAYSIVRCECARHLNAPSPSLITGLRAGETTPPSRFGCLRPFGGRLSAARRCFHRASFSTTDRSRIPYRI